MFNRAAIKTAMEGDFDTGNMRFKARERYSFGVSDWRCVFGTPSLTLKLSKIMKGDTCRLLFFLV